MIDSWLALLDAYRLGDLASLVGLLVALVGFALTIWAAWRAKSAAEMAAAAARRVRDQILIFQSTSDLAGAISKLESLKSMHRAGDWASMPERYSGLSADLAMIRDRSTLLDDAERAMIQKAIFMLAQLEHELDVGGVEEPDRKQVAIRNLLISQRLDELRGILHHLQERAAASYE